MDNTSILIFPAPKNVEWGEGNYRLKQNMDAESLYDFWCAVKNGNADISYDMSPVLGYEEYRLCVGEDGIMIEASSECGKFRAVTSLRQLILEFVSELPCITIHDLPDFERRGYMLDISRGRIAKVETIKGLIDELSALKYNEFQLYMESFCFHYSLIPELSDRFDGLTPEDIHELDEYCKERFIDLVPNQNSFGHMSAWLSEGAFRHLAVGNKEHNTGTINPLLPETLATLDRIYSSLFPHFTSQYANIGMDEAYGLGKYQLEEACQGAGRAKVFFDYLDKLNGLSAKHGKKVMFWDDMIVKNPEYFDLIPKDATAMHWGYDLIQSQLFEESCASLEAHNVRFYVCPGDSTWNAYTGRSDVMTFNIRTAAEVGKKHGAAGFLFTHWGDSGHQQFMSVGFIPCALAGQYAWNVGGEQTGEAFKTDYIYSAKKYADKYIYHGHASDYIFRLSDYYLHEPERIHNGTMSGMSVNLPMSAKEVGDFNLNCFDPGFYFQNTAEYLRKVIADIEKTEFDPIYKREILVNAKTALLGAILMILRIDSGDKVLVKTAIAMIDELIPEYEYLWDKRNYHVGCSRFSETLGKRKSELLSIF